MEYYSGLPVIFRLLGVIFGLTRVQTFTPISVNNPVYS